MKGWWLLRYLVLVAGAVVVVGLPLLAGAQDRPDAPGVPAGTPVAQGGAAGAPGAQGRPVAPAGTPVAPAERAGAPAQVGTVVRNANVRAGPSTRYAVVGSAPAGTTVRVAATNKAGDWYQLTNGRWIAAFLVDLNGGGSAAPVPTLPPTPAPAHSAPVTAPAQGTAGAVPGQEAAAPGAAPAQGAPGAAPGQVTAGAAAAVPAQAAAGNRFVLVERRLWDVYENGGWLDGPSVHCGDGRELVVTVLDSSGARLNGVAVQVQYGAREIEVTGAQGKGDGVAEFVLGGGQDVQVVRDTDGSPATSDMATGLSTNPSGISHADLIAARYCQDEASCGQFVASYGCGGHFSWSVTFQRR